MQVLAIIIYFFLDEHYPLTHITTFWAGTFEAYGASLMDYVTINPYWHKHLRKEKLIKEGGSHKKEEDDRDIAYIPLTYSCTHLSTKSPNLVLA